MTEGSTLRVGYYDESGAWHDKGSSEAGAQSMGWTTDNTWKNELLAGANGGQYVIEVGAASGAIRTSPLEFRTVSDTADIKAMVTENGKVGQYNITVVNSDGYSIANVPEHEFELNITLENRYANIESIAIVSAYESTEVTSTDGEITGGKNADGKSYTYTIANNALRGTDKWLAIRVQPQDETADSVYHYLRMTVTSDDLSLNKVTVIGEDAEKSTTDDSVSYTYTLRDEYAEYTSAGVELNTTDTDARITGINKETLEEPSNSWTDTNYALETGEVTTLTADAHSQLYVDEETTPNAYTTYTLNIYRKSDNAALGSITAEYTVDDIKTTVEAIRSKTEEKVYDLWIPEGIAAADITAETESALAKVKVAEKPADDTGYSLNTDTKEDAEIADNTEIKVYVKPSSAAVDAEPATYTVKVHTLDLGVKTDETTGNEIGISASADNTTFTTAVKSAENDDTYTVLLAGVENNTAYARIKSEKANNYVRIGYIQKPDGSDEAALEAFNTLAQSYDTTAEGFTWTTWSEGQATQQVGLVETDGAYTMVKMQVSAVEITEETPEYLYKTYDLLIRQPYGNAALDIYVNTRDSASLKQMVKLTDSENITEEGVTYITYRYGIAKNVGSDTRTSAYPVL